MTTNGTPPDLPAALAEVFDYQRWRRLTELAIKRGEALLAQARDAVTEAQGAMRERERELDVLRRALALQVRPGTPSGEAPAAPAPPRPPVRSVPLALTRSPDEVEALTLPPLPEIARGAKDGRGNGYRAGMYLLEVIRVRGTGTLTSREADLACSGWRSSTVHDGLKRLVQDGLLERYALGHYRLTQAGRDLCADGPVPAVLLPLADPGRDEPRGPSGEEQFSAGEPRPVAEWVRERVIVEYGKDEAATLVPHPEENGALARR